MVTWNDVTNALNTARAQATNFAASRPLAATGITYLALDVTTNSGEATVAGLHNLAKDLDPQIFFETTDPVGNPIDMVGGSINYVGEATDYEGIKLIGSGIEGFGETISDPGRLLGFEGDSEWYNDIEIGEGQSHESEEFTESTNGVEEGHDNPANTEYPAGQDYTDILDSTSEHVVEDYFAEVETDTGQIQADEITLEYNSEINEYELGVQGYEEDLVLSQKNSFDGDEVAELAQNKDNIRNLFENKY